MTKSTSTTPKTDEAIETDKVTEAAKKAAHEKAVRDKNNKEMKAAKAEVTKFQDTDEFKALPKDVQTAIKRICGKKRAPGLMKDTFIDTLKKLFPKTKTAVKELAVFMETKMGRGEFRKRVRESLKKAEPANRLWIEFDEDSESWVLLQIGGKQPKAFKGKAIA